MTSAGWPRRSSMDPTPTTPGSARRRPATSSDRSRTSTATARCWSTTARRSARPGPGPRATARTTGGPRSSTIGRSSSSRSGSTTAPTMAGGSRADQVALRDYYTDLLAMCQDPSVLGSGYWGLEYFNNPAMFGDCPDGLYSFARFEPGSARVLLVVGNFSVGAAASGPVRLPQELVDAVGLSGQVEVRKRLDRGGSRRRAGRDRRRRELGQRRVRGRRRGPDLACVRDRVATR